MGTSPPKKRRKHGQFPPSQSAPHLLIPLESRLEDNPVHPQRGLEESSSDSSESEESLTGGPVEGAELVPQAYKIWDTSLNFQLGPGGTQVMAQYSKPKSPPPPPVTESAVLFQDIWP